MSGNTCTLRHFGATSKIDDYERNDVVTVVRVHAQVFPDLVFIDWVLCLLYMRVYIVDSHGHSSSSPGSLSRGHSFPCQYSSCKATPA